MSEESGWDYYWVENVSVMVDRKVQEHCRFHGLTLGWLISVHPKSAAETIENGRLGCPWTSASAIGPPATLKFTDGDPLPLGDRKDGRRGVGFGAANAPGCVGALQ